MLERLQSAVSGTLVINGAMQHFQRGTGARTATTTYNTDTSYAADRFFVRPVGASVTVQQSATVPAGLAAETSLQITGAASVTTVDIGQRIRYATTQARGKQSLNFTCYIQNLSGSAFTPTLRIGTPASADNFTTVTNRLSQTLQAAADSAWTRVYHTFSPAAFTNIDFGMEVVLQVPSGSLVSGDTVRIWGFDLRPGVASAVQTMPYIVPDRELELLRCLPYCQVLGTGIGGAVNTSTRVVFKNTIVPRMRANPTAVLTDASILVLDVGTGSPTSAASTIVGSNLQANGYYLDIDGFTGLTLGRTVIPLQDFALLIAEL
jgi:hypothetical protein